MAKDVDLSSHKWREIVFEGKNKEFGAYQLRKNSSNRHTKAMIIVSAVLTAILTIIILIYSGVIGGGEEVDPNAGVDQALVNLANEEEQPEEEQPEVIEQEPEPEPEPEPEIEEVAQTKMTELVIEDDKNVKQENQVKELDLTDDTNVGTQNVESDNKDVKEAITQIAAPPAPPKEEEKPKEEPKPEPKPEPSQRLSKSLLQ